MLSTSLFYLGFISITWTSYQTRTNLIFFEFLVFPYFILLSAALFIFFTTATRTLYSNIICIICIYNITCISGFSRLGNIYIICIICTIYIINISLLWTKCGHCPHPFTDISILYMFIKSKMCKFLIFYLL